MPFGTASIFAWSCYWAFYLCAEGVLFVEAMLKMLGMDDSIF